MQIRLTIGKEQFTAELYANPVAEQFGDLLPTEVVFNDFNGVEKVGRLERSLTLRGVPDRDDPGPGEIGYYAPSQGIVLYYGHVGTWAGLVRLGRFTFDLGVLRALPDGSRAQIERV